MSGASTDPRPARSRARLLDAATTLLRSGGPNAVTIDAVTRTANVARATLYRHFSSANDLMAAAFMSLLNPAPMPPVEGSVRDRLVAVVEGWAESIAEVPTMITAMTWMASGPDVGTYSDVQQSDSDSVGTLRARIIQLYSMPFDAILDSPQAAEELDEVDRMQTIALLIGPLIIGKLSTVADFDYRACASAAVDGFMATHRKRTGDITSASSESGDA
ncbi:TetR/AcrR family transcriptional regulator [Mycolicibacterium sp. GF69]|uniref:TetR/AcrR family transcriptional regulator n=1 Tax=Mycolicibacterium sp. GF69 TaxID=2267251 RepID=UPI000DCBD92E|nr:TetR/AcrR family transcriptional regulator [Mycolicibacterium sp. GF69]RAV17103.1 TetR/AcrR family transcriptional regulator [Mycolicibacterium sp. GF69]